MSGFLKLLPPTEALNILLDRIEYEPRVELVETISALGRVTSQPVIAPFSLPSFPRSTMDGYAVRASDTFGANETTPTYLNVVGEVQMGESTTFILLERECALIHTGGMLPGGADAVVMVENTQLMPLDAKKNSDSINYPHEVEILHSVAIGENIIEVGEDVSAGQEVIARGTRIRPAEIGGLMTLGLSEVNVVVPPRLGILSSGDEVIPPGVPLTLGKVFDSNSFSLSALVEKVGGMAFLYGIVPDQEQALFNAAAQAIEECDLLVITAGSSASSRDLTAQVINQLGPPGVLVHGVNIRPGKPTILAICNGKPVIGLPGNPVSALVIASLFVTPVIEKMLGIIRNYPKPRVSARLSMNLPSQAGREDWMAVRLVPTKDGYVADPIFGKSNLIFTLVRADGMVRIPSDATGLSAGESLEVVLL